MNKKRLLKNGPRNKKKPNCRLEASKNSRQIKCSLSAMVRSGAKPTHTVNVSHLKRIIHLIRFGKLWFYLILIIQIFQLKWIISFYEAWTVLSQILINFTRHSIVKIVKNLRKMYANCFRNNLKKEEKHFYFLNQN